MKVSNYNIEVDYDKGIILYNSYTDKMMPMSYKDYSIVETLMENLFVFEEKYPLLYRSFVNSGFIIQDDMDELALIKLRNKYAVYANQNYHITINPTLDCNLKCWYCSVDAAGTIHNHMRMSDQLVNGLIMHIKKLIVLHKAKSIVLDWFGGEPLMYFDEVIKKVSKASMSLAKENKIHFSQQITTNGTLLTEERIRHMKESNFIFFQISMDGNKEHHNAVKKYANKKGTYIDVVNNINLLSEMIPDISICLRINYDKQGLKSVSDIIKDLSDKSRKLIAVDFHKVWQIEMDNNMKSLLSSAYEDFRAMGIKTRYWAYLPKRDKSCYADSLNHYVVNFDGNIFKCSARDYSEKLRIGKLLDSGEIEWKYSLLSKMFEKSTFDHEMCLKCKKLPLCMGPCIQHNYDYAKSNTEIRCIYENIEIDLKKYLINKAKELHLIHL